MNMYKLTTPKLCRRHSMKQQIYSFFILFIVISSITIAQSTTEYNEIPLEDTDYLEQYEYMWYRFWFKKGQKIVVTLEVPSTADMDLYIQTDNSLDDSNNDGYLDDEGEYDLLAKSTSSTFGDDERIDWEVPSTGEYFIIVSAYEGYGTYTLHVREAGRINVSLLIGVVVVIGMIGIVGIFALLKHTKRKKEASVPILPLPPEPQTPVENLRYCPICGSRNSEDAVYCASCGARLG